MARERPELLLAKILTAAAWADGRVDPDERAAVMHCIRHLALSDAEAESVEALLAQPVPRNDVHEFTAAFVEATSADDAIRTELLARVRQVLGDRSALTPAEVEFLGLVAEAIERDREPESFLGRIKSLFTAGALRTDSSRRSPVAERLRQKLRTPRATNDDDPAHDDMATLYGALLHTVALADGRVTDDEVRFISDFLRRSFAYEDRDVDLIVDALRLEVDENVELFRLTSEFNRVTDQATRVELVEAMLALAASDGVVADDELLAVRRVSDHLWVSRRDFNELRLRYAASA